MRPVTTIILVGLLVLIIVAAVIQLLEAASL